MLEELTNRLYKTGEKKTAIELLEALYRHSLLYEEYDDLAKCAFKMKEYMQAIKYAKDALSSADSPEKLWAVRSNLINLYNHANYPELAMKLIKINELINPDDYDMRMEKAFSYYLLSRKDDAEAIIKNELKRNDLTSEQRTKLSFNLGTYELYRDNFLRGLELFTLEGRRMGFWQQSELDGIGWIGQPAEGKKIFVVAEAGIGDELINVRFMKHLKEKGMDPIWHTNRKDIARIFNDNGFKTTNNISDFKPGGLWTLSMTLPLYLQCNYDNLWYGPYLKASDKFIKKYSWIRDLPGRKIGLRWEGNPEYDHDLHRSVPLVEMVAEMPKNSSLISLQRDTGLEQLKTLPHIKDMSSHMETFEDTLGIIHNLDIVVTSCTSVAHAAAAMGKRTIILTPISAYYVWSHSTKQSPWYGDNVTLLRQERPRVWEEPISKLGQLLQE